MIGTMRNGFFFVDTGAIYEEGYALAVPTNIKTLLAGNAVEWARIALSAPIVARSAPACKALACARRHGKTNDMMPKRFEVNTMSNIISNAVSKLSATTDQTPIDWDALDSLLKRIEDINTYDDQCEETILSEFIMCGDFYNRGTVLADIVRHFLSCGYDVSANEGMNGGLALSALCWSSYDQHILDAAKVLMNAGAPVIYRSRHDDPNEKPEGLIGDISWKLSGAWMVDKDFGFANTLEAYYAMAEANLAGKDYNSIDSYFACIGKSLTAVSALKNGGTISLQNEGAISVYTEPLIMWFGDQPLIVSCYTDFVVNPVYADDKKADLSDVTTVFSSLVGATLQEVQYIGTTICYFEFSNGKRMFFASREIGDRKRVGTFEIRAIGNKVDIEQLNVDCFCGINGCTFASTVTDYSEDAIALFCDDAAYLLYLHPGTTGKYQFDICPCSRELLAEYARQYPLKRPAKIKCMYEQNGLSAIRLDCPEGYLYMKAMEYTDIQLQLSDKLYNPLEYSVLPRKEGRHMEFLKRNGDQQ